MITPLTKKLFLHEYQSPYYKVKDKFLYSKVGAVKYCKEIGWEWPSFHVWDQSQKFHRPTKTFEESIKTQCEIVTDCYRKVRLFYSGGRDSSLILHSLLKNKSRLDEIAIYRRFPGVIDNTSNEFDKFNVLEVLKNILQQYNVKIPIKFYDLLPEHFNYYSKNLDKLYFDYSDLDFFTNNVHTLAECFPTILENDFINILGHAIPNVNDNNEFYWVDTDFNLSQPDPYTMNFFIDHRNTDLAVNLAYEVYDYQKQSKNTRSINQYGSGPDSGFKPIKERLNFPKNGTALDNDWGASGATTNVFRWVLEKKIITHIANALQSDIGTESYTNFIGFYEEFEKKYYSYFHDNSIYTYWIGSISESHKLLDT